MKNKILVIIIIVLMQNIVCLCSASIPDGYAPESDVLNYSDAKNWILKEMNPIHDVDMFYILPTVIMNGTDSATCFTDESKKIAELAYMLQAKSLSEFTNVFVPCYRQIPMNISAGIEGAENNAAFVARQKGHLDIFAALDYYFENLNGGRPFILASHSQGTAVNRVVLDTYMKQHPEYLSRMVADYALGFSLPMNWFAANPHIKPAKGETDFGVVIGFNTEGPGAILPSMLCTADDYVINPITWTTTDEYASASQNAPSLVRQSDGTWQFVEHYADAKIDPQRRVVVCTTCTDYMKMQAFGDKSLHLGDWSLYYCSIRENARKRIAAYMKSR